MRKKSYVENANFGRKNCLEKITETKSFCQANEKKANTK